MNDLPLKSVGILITYKCPIRCRHCCITCGPRRTGVIELDLAERLLRQSSEIGLTGMEIHLGGGEAFLFFDRLIEVLGIARKLDMTPIAWLETCSHWCRSDDLVRERFKILKESGIHKMYLSTDPYHQEFVPMEKVARARRIAIEVFGEDRLTVSRQQYFDEPDKWKDFGEYAREFPPMLMGRAYDCLRQYLPRRPVSEFADERCPDRVDPTRMSYVHINPDGTVMATNCTGIIIGDARETTLAELHSDPGWRRNDILRVLAESGPVGLLDMASGFEPRETYASKCELCWEIRAHLAPAYPETLAPPECYVDGDADGRVGEE